MNSANYPIFHPDEGARIGLEAFDKRVRGRHCTVRCVIKAIDGEYRYGVRTDDEGIYTVVLESTLRKRFERSDWGMLRGIWQPDRTQKASRPTGWKEFK